MITLENQKKLQELENNKEFNQSLVDAASPEELKSIFAQYNVELTIDEISSMIQDPEEELLESDLENVSGGLGRRFGLGCNSVKWVQIPPHDHAVLMITPFWKK